MNLFIDATIQKNIMNTPETMSIGGCGPMGEGGDEFTFDDLGKNSELELIGMGEVDGSGEGEYGDNEPILVSFAIGGGEFDDDVEEEITWGGCEQLLELTYGEGLANFITQQADSSSSHNLSSFVQSTN